MIKKFNEFNESNFPTSKEEIGLLCEKYKIKNYSINSDLSIDVQGDVYLSGLNLKSLPLRFSRVSGYFTCSSNLLTTLEGGPREVGGHFNCSSNRLTTLEGGPIEVGGYFSCYSNHLTTLEGGPREVGGYFYCYSNQLTTLEGGPREVGGDFYCSYNHLTTLKGGPREVGGDFICHSNPVSEIIDIFPDRKMVLKFWDEFRPVRGNIVFDHRLREMYLDITNEEFKGVFKFKNYEINYD
jgi:hypothetical protein